MDVSQKEAKDSLNQIQEAATYTRKTITASYDSGLLIMWGLICIAAFLGTHFFHNWAGYIWWVLSGAGVVLTFLVVRHQFRQANPTKTPAAERIGWRIFWFWTLLFVYIFVWLSVLAPVKDLQMNAFIITVIMFAYVVTGLWFRSYHMLWLGIVVTCTTLVGYYLIPVGYYCLWMATTAGGAILGTGLYTRFFWK